MRAYPSFDLTGRVALVTGAARGLGSAITLALAHAGADIALPASALKKPLASILPNRSMPWADAYFLCRWT